MSATRVHLGASRPTDRGTRRHRCNSDPQHSSASARPGRARLTLSIDGVDYLVRPIDREPGDGLAAGFLLHELDDAGRSVGVIEIHEYHDPLDSPLLNGLPGLACSCSPTPEDCGAPPCRHLKAATVAGLLRPLSEADLWDLGGLAPTAENQDQDQAHRLAFEAADPSLWASFPAEDESQEVEGGEPC